MINIIPFSLLSRLTPIKELLSPYTKRAYLVGGCVRDLLLGKDPNDLDIEVYDIEPRKFDKIMQKEGANGVGKSYFVYKLGEFDLSLPRTENKIGKGHKAFEVSYCNSEKEASLRRDFTINAMMLNIFTGELLDFHNGESNLKNGIIRHVNDEKFAEDSLRVLRGVRFASRFGVEIAPETMRLMKTLSLNDISADRIGNELIKIFQTDHQDSAVEVLWSLGLFKWLFGISVDKEATIKSFGEKVKKAFEASGDYRQFIYLLRGNFDLKENILEKLRLPNDFKACFEQPYNEEADARFLLKLSFKIPIKEWLGANTLEIVETAKELGVYERAMKNLGISLNGYDVIRDGFQGIAVGVEINRRQDKIVEQILEGKIRLPIWGMR